MKNINLSILLSTLFLEVISINQAQAQVRLFGAEKKFKEFSSNSKHNKNRLNHQVTEKIIELSLNRTYQGEYWCKEINDELRELGMDSYWDFESSNNGQYHCQSLCTFDIYHLPEVIAAGTELSFQLSYEVEGKVHYGCQKLSKIFNDLNYRNQFFVTSEKAGALMRFTGHKKKNWNCNLIFK